MGDFGLRSAERCADAACWASWADPLEMINQRTPAVADMVVRAMEQEAPATGCLFDLQVTSQRLDNEGFWWRPSWTASRDGKRPPVNTSGEPSEWPHGWQCWASSISDTFCWKNFPVSIQLQIGHTSDHIQDAMRWSPSPMRPRPRSARSRHTFSACCSWSDCNCHCQSQRRHVKGATVSSTSAGSTEQLARSADA